MDRKTTVGNPGATITINENYKAESFQLGVRCPLVLAMRSDCGLCKKKMYPAILQNYITGEIKKGFICFRCGGNKIIDDQKISDGGSN